MIETIKINGKEYAPNTSTASSKKSNFTSMAMSIAAIAAMMSAEMYGVNTYVRKLRPNIDVVKEFGLIELKQSSLSKWERDEVVRIFNKHYKLVNNDFNQG